jgi:alkylation response protein AidB-like acyl-CoA dehydrogenase
MGIQIAKKEQKLGIRASSTCTLNFDDLKVPAENIIGGEGLGYKIAIEILNEGLAVSPVFLLSLLRRHIGRIGIAAQMLGLAQGAFDKAVPYTYERKQFGQPVGTFQGMAFQFAQAAVDLESARLLTYNAARRKEEGRSFTKEAAMAKYWASVVAQRVSGQAIEWAGGVGFTRETGIEKFWRDSKIVSRHLSATEEFLLYLIDSPPRFRAPSTKGHPTFNYRLLLSSFRRNTHSRAPSLRADLAL